MSFTYNRHTQKVGYDEQGRQILINTKGGPDEQLARKILSGERVQGMELVGNTILKLAAPARRGDEGVQPLRYEARRAPEGSSRLGATDPKRQRGGPQPRRPNGQYDFVSSGTRQSGTSSASEVSGGTRQSGASSTSGVSGATRQSGASSTSVASQATREDSIRVSQAGSYSRSSGASSTSQVSRATREY